MAVQGAVRHEKRKQLSLSALFQSPIFLASVLLPRCISTSCKFSQSAGSDS
jgi:hypothetical protein